MKTPPRFKHDCNKCKYLGQFGPFDIYECPTQSWPQFVFRYGNEGPEYASPYITKEKLELAEQLCPNMSSLPEADAYKHLWIVCHAGFTSIACHLIKL